jgi:hypothetical protein
VQQINLGTKGHIEVKLARTITPTALVVAHAHPATLFKDSFKAAPRQMSAYGVVGDRQVLLARFEFDPKDGKRIVELSSRIPHVSRIFWNIESNWGNEKWTCIYRLSVHGSEE